MKISNRLMLSMAFAFVFFTSTFAQRGGGERPSAEEIAKRQTTHMTESLELTKEQSEKVADINLKYTKQAQEARKKARDQEEKDHEAMKTARKEARDAYNAELKTVLTDLQYAKLEGIQEARAERHNKRGGAKGKRGGKKGEKDGKDKG